MKQQLISTFAFLALPMSAAIAADFPYTVSLTTPNGAKSITTTGTVLGEDNNLWTSNNGTQAIDPTPYQWSQVWAVNNNGIVAGAVVMPDGSSPYGSQPSIQGWGAAAYGTSGHITLLPPLTPSPTAFAEAYGINDSGVVVGESGNSADQSRKAVRWTNGIADDLSLYLNPANGSSSAGSINNNGQVVITQGTRSFVLTGNQLAPIAISDPSVSAYFGGIINDNGQVAGTAYFTNGTAEGFIWDAGQMQMAPSLDSSIPSITSFGGINRAGVTVGFWEPVASGQATAIMWSGTGNPIDLNSLIDPNSGWHLYNAIEINDDGDIVGNGLLNGEAEGFLLTPTGISPASTPTPEPTTAILLLLAAPLLLRRHRHP
jgi:hypothetical protein